MQLLPTRLHPATPARRRMAGFGLVEIMIAMLIGMVGVLVMTQVLSASESQKRTSTGGNDALNEGALALYAVQGDLRMAGYGIADSRILGCSLLLRAGLTLPALAPVTINPAVALLPAGDPNTDTLLVFYSKSFGTPQGDLVLGVSNTMTTPSAFVANDWVVNAPATRPANCALSLDQVASVANSKITLNSATTAAVGNPIFDFGQTYRAIGYAIRNRNLTTCDYTNAAVDCTATASWTAINTNIVSLRAQYGRDVTGPPMDAIVDQYDQVTPVAEPPTSVCAWARISAVRIALVARSPQMDAAAVTGAAPTWDGTNAGNPVGSTAAAIDLTLNPDSSANASWQNFRYRVFQTVVPLRNVAWLGVVTGC